jgi:flagellar hook-associated protein 3 FlgL
MRIATNTYTNSLIDQLNSLALRQSQLQNQVATGKRVQNPADDPAAMRRVLDLQAEAGSVTQFQSNIASEQDRATAVYSALKSLKTVSDRASEIATSADDLKSPAELSAYASEITQLIQQSVQAANAQHNGTGLFGGTQTDQPAFVLATDAAGHVTSVTYQGDQGVAPTEISEGVTVSSQIVGANTTGAGPRGLITDSASGADFFNHLISLQNHLLSGDTADIAATDRSQLTKDEDNLIFHVSDNGAVQSRLEASASLLSDRATGLDGQISQQSDADLAQTLVHLSASQNAYQAALQSGAKLFGLSLMDYLR